MERLQHLDKLIEVFKQIKAENDEALKRNKHLFVNLDAFKKLQEVGPFVFVGRKGVGKTALINQFKKIEKKKYDIIIDIIADQEQSWALYNFFFKKFSTILDSFKENELQDIIDIDKLFATAWAGAIQVAIMDRLIKHEHKYRDAFEEELMTIKKYLADSFEIDYTKKDSLIAKRVQSLLPVIFELIQLKIDISLNNVKSIGVFLARIANWLTESIEKRVIGDEANCALKKIITAKNLKVLITLDKYDDYVDGLIKNLDNSEEISRRIKGANSLSKEQVLYERENMLLFQRSMLKGLLLASKELRETSSYDLTHYAYAIPQDRYVELNFREEAQFNSIFKVDINWNPISLLQFFVKRSCFVLSIENGSRNFEDLIADYRKVLKELQIQEFVPNSVVNSTREDFFLYILRHTLWRPRDIQRYLINFFELYKKSIIKNPDVSTTNIIRKAIEDHSLKIIQDEFFLEYKVEYPYLESVVQRFRKRSYILSNDELRDSILNTKLSLSNVNMSKDEIITRLYNVGFLGIRSKTNLKSYSIKQNNQYIDYSFYYNDGVQNLNNKFGGGASILDAEEWVIHPLFYDFLDCKVENKYVVHEMDWINIKKKYEHTNFLFD
nr:hypothetical protein [uncultured Draconibacterium sp.]